MNQLTFFQSSVKKRKEDDFKMIAYAYEYHNNKVKCDDLDLAFFFQLKHLVIHVKGNYSLKSYGGS